jgi:3-methyladenine DNA glycosylase Tag
MNKKWYVSTGDFAVLALVNPSRAIRVDIKTHGIVFLKGSSTFPNAQMIFLVSSLSLSRYCWNFVKSGSQSSQASPDRTDGRRARVSCRVSKAMTCHLFAHVSHIFLADQWSQIQGSGFEN